MTEKTKPAAKKAAPKKPAANVPAVVDKVAEKAAEVTKANLKLSPLAKEVNVRFEKIAKLEGDANDHRLAAALRLAEAEKIAVAAGIKFRDWAVENIKEQSWETVRKLVYVGKSEDPKLALTDQRKANAKRNQEHRAKKKEAPAAKVEAPKPKDVVLALKPEEQTKLVNDVAKDLGLVVRTKSEIEAEKQKNREATAAPVEKPAKPTFATVTAAIDALSAADQIKVLRYVAEKHLYKVVEPSKDQDFEAIPDFLKKK